MLNPLNFCPQVKHALDLFVDFAAIFVRILVSTPDGVQYCDSRVDFHAATIEVYCACTVRSACGCQAQGSQMEHLM